MNLLIERAEINDAAEVLELQKIAYESEAILYDDRSIPPLTQTLDDIREEFERKTFLKACNGGRIIASVRAYVDSKICHIGRLIVHPEYQRKGTGAQLMSAIEEEFPSAVRFELFTGSESEGNIRLHERLGYKIFREERLSQRVELVFMEKLRR